MRIDPTAWTGMAIARCLAEAAQGRWTAARLAAATGASARDVGHVLGRLSAAQLVRWSPELGSYVLARPAAQITVADIVAAAGAAPPPDDSAAGALTAAVWPSLLRALGGVTLSEALAPAGAGGYDGTGGHDSPGGYDGNAATAGVVGSRAIH